MPRNPGNCRDSSITSITRYSRVRANGGVLVLLYVFLFVFCQQFLDNPRADSSQILHAGIHWFRMCLLPFWGLLAPGGGKRVNEIFVTIGVNGGFVSVQLTHLFKRYLAEWWFK